jgi:hypothetical protein
MFCWPSHPLYPLRPPRLYFEWLRPELADMENFAIAQGKEGDRWQCLIAVRCRDFGGDFISAGDQFLDRDAPLAGIMAIHGDEIVSAAYALAGLRHLEDKIIVQEWRDSLKLEAVKNCPEGFDDLAILIGQF